MSRIRSKDTAPELTVRRLLSGAGHRYRLHRKDLPGKPDIVFVSRRKAIFVHGCFWHQHPRCRLAAKPKSNRGYWGPKLRRNRERDARARRELRGIGWESLVLWECEIRRGRHVAKLKKFLDG